MKWIKWGFRPHLCIYRLNLARRISWRWWDECDDTALLAQNLKFEPYRSRRFPTILNYYEWAGTIHFLPLKLDGQSGVRARDLRLSKHAKWNESGFRPPLCTYRLNWARRTSWGWWDDWDDTVLQTQDSKFEPWRSEAEHATSRSRRLPAILTFTRGWGRNIFVSFKPPSPGTEPRTLAWKAAVLTTTLGPPPSKHAALITAPGPPPLSSCSRFDTTVYMWFWQ